MYGVKDLQPNDTSRGWDGTFKGDKVDLGVYVWLAKVKFSDGNEEVLTGDVTLMR